MLRSLSLLILLLLSPCFGLHQPKSVKQVVSSGLQQALKTIAATSVLVAPAVLIKPTQALAVKGSIQEAGVEESKKAALQIKAHINGLAQMEALADQGKYDDIAELLATIDFGCFDTVVRSTVLSPDDKIALGTIKRYGYIADAIIMVGGISEALKAGGVKVKSTGVSLQKSIEEDSEEEEEEGSTPQLTVDKAELKKYVRLALGSFKDIDKIVAPILAK